MQGQNHSIPRGAILGCAIGALLMAFFGTLWSSLAAGSLNGWGSSFLTPLVYVMGIFLLASSIYLFISAREFSKPDEEQRKEGERMNKWFGITFGLEGVLIGVVSVILNSLNRFDILLPIIALIVGIHFYPFAFIFRRKIDYLFSAITCIAAIAALFIGPAEAQINGITINTSLLVCGLGATIGTWGYGIYSLVVGQKLLNKVRAAKKSAA